MYRSLLGAMAAVAALTCTACDGGDDSDSADPKSESTSESSTPTTDSTDTTPGTLSAEELQAKVITGTPPKDLIWQIPAAPSDWRELKVEEGTRQWKVGESPCVVSVNQPAGLGTDPSPTSEEVARDFVTSNVQAASATPTFDAATERLFANHVNADAVQVQSQFTGLHFTAAPGDLEGQAYGYRDGDFALRAIALCGSGAYDDNSAALEGFLESLSANTTY